MFISNYKSVMATGNYGPKFGAALLATTFLSPLVTPADARIDELVVTATGRSTSVLDVPYNISAISEETLDRAGIDDISELVRLVPGVTFNDLGPRQAGNNNTLVIRGLTAESGSGAFEIPSIARSTVSTYVGETPVFSNFKLTDVERVEVLRGPQGTLYGSGSLGGTLRILPNRPDTSGYDARVDVSASSTADSDEYNYSFDGMVNVPLGDKAAFRVSGGYEELGGFVDAEGLAVRNSDGSFALANPGDFLGSGPLLTGSEEDSDDSNITHLRAALGFQPTDSIDAVLTYQFQNVEADNFQGSDLDLDRALTHNDTNTFESDLNLVSLEANADLGFAKLTSATSYYKADTQSQTDQSDFFQEFLAYYYGGFPRISTGSNFETEEKTFVQEFRLASQGGERFDWLLGMFYMDQDIEFDQQQVMPGFNDYVAADAFLLYYYGAMPLDSRDTLFTDDRKNSFEEFALFGELTFRPIDKWQITVGARTFWETIDFARATNYSLFFASVNETSSRDIDDTIFKVNTSYEIGDSTSAYFTFSQGFRNGGVNAFDTSGSFFDETAVDIDFDFMPDFLFPNINEFDQDEVNNFEIGIKGSNTDGSLNYSLAAFYVDWKDPQLRFEGWNSFTDGAINSTADAVSRGVELELFGDIGDNFNYSFGYAYVDAEFAEDGFVYITPVQDGDSLPNNSNHTLTASLDYSKPIANGMDVNFHLDGFYRSDFNNGVKGSRTDVDLESFEIINGSVSLVKDNVSLSLFGRNLTDNDGTTGGAFTGVSNDYVYVTRPRTIGLKLTWKLGE